VPERAIGLSYADEAATGVVDIEAQPAGFRDCHVDFAGIFVGAPLLIAAIMLLLSERSIIVIALTSTIPVLTVYVLARHVLMMPLP
jgi:hypothetical protein